jgi:REP element-mobilizing transposase RayT
MRILAYCLMRNHWHLVLYPRADGDLSKFLRRITLTHTQRYEAKEKPTVWFGEMGVEGGGAIRPGKHDAESRAPEKRFLSPFSP